MGTETMEDVLVVDLRGRSTGDRIRLRRVALGLSQWDLAQRLSLSQTAVSQAERGQLHGPRQTQLEQALRELAISAGKPAISRP
jgi:transcriptional regulator with XRE-family HTH domain